MKKILGPWEPRDLCVKRFDDDGQCVGLVSYILQYEEDGHPLAEVDALLRLDGYTLFEDATPKEQEAYVKQRMVSREKERPSPNAKSVPGFEAVGGLPWKSS